MEITSRINFNKKACNDNMNSNDLRRIGNIVRHVNGNINWNSNINSNINGSNNPNLTNMNSSISSPAASSVGGSVDCGNNINRISLYLRSRYGPSRGQCGAQEQK